MSDTTSINDLPTNPLNGGDNRGIKFEINENSQNTQNVNHNQSQSPLTLDQSTINQIVNGLQQASSTGITQLQSRDIPMSVENLVQDNQIQPNYIPTTSNNDYIQKQADNNTIINNYNNNYKQMDRLDQLYEEIQTPLLIAVLFFIFQLPIVKKMLYKFIPGLFYKDGNSNIYGYIFTSSLFGILYYIISKIIVLFSTF